MVSSTTGKEFKLGEGYKPTTRADIIQRFLESKEAPLLSLATALVKGKTSLGEDVNIPAEVIDRFIPMIVQDGYDLFREYGPQGLLMTTPGFFGVGSQTYADQIPVKAKTKTGRETIKWRSAPGIGEAVVNKVTGTKITDIPESEQQTLRDERLKETMRNIEIDKIKTRVLETGKSEQFEGTVIYLDNGVVKTKKIKESSRPKKKKTSVKTKKSKSKSAKTKASKKVALSDIKVKTKTTSNVPMKSMPKKVSLNYKAPKGGKSGKTKLPRKRGNKNRSLYS